VSTEPEAALVHDPGLSRLWTVVHTRLEATGGLVEGASVRLRCATEAERRRVDLLLGTRSRSGDLRVPLDRLDTVLRARADTSLSAVVQRAVGPLRDRPFERFAKAEAEAGLWDSWLSHPAAGSEAVAAWLESVRSTGRWRRLDDPSAQMRSALDVLARLPASPRIGRSRLAAEVVGDAHALDDSAPVGRLVLSALAHVASSGSQPRAAAERRSLWAGAGVYLDTSSSTVLTFGLRPALDGPATDAAGRWADSATPLRIPLAAIEAEDWRVDPGEPVFVCENPAVVDAAAATLGDTSHTLVCVEGHPSAASHRLIGSLVRHGAAVRYHGDFGSGGIAIANTVIGELGATPWRLRTEDHAAALSALSDTGATLRPLRGRVPAAAWDRGLATAIEACGVEVEEEHVLDLLLHDLAT